MRLANGRNVMHSACEAELETQHHSQSGPGVIDNHEEVILALFCPDGAPRSTVGREDFPTKSLAKTGLSVARRRYTTKDAFNSHVIGDGSKGVVYNLAISEVSVLRNLNYTVSGLHPPVSGRQVCVVDKVAPDDHDGHAAIGFASWQNSLTQNQKGTARAFIVSNLITAFNKTADVNEAFNSESARI